MAENNELITVSTVLEMLEKKFEKQEVVADKLASEGDMKVKQQYISKWKRMNYLPASLVLAACKLLDWEIKPHMIDPHLYPKDLIDVKVPQE